MFGLGFAEIVIIAIIAILFLGPDKLPSAMVEVAKFFRNVKSTVGSVKSSIEEEMHVADIKEEALAYKRELLEAQDKMNKATDIDQIANSVSQDIENTLNDVEQPAKQEEKKEAPKAEKVTFEKKSKYKDA